MANIQRLVVVWSGSPVVGGGISVFYQSTSGSVGFANDILAFFVAIRNSFPLGITWNVPSSGDVINDVDGGLVSTWSDTGTGGLATSNGTANFASGVGARVVWNTGGIYRGRRVRGSTFLLPLVASAYPNNNTLDDGIVGTFQTAASALVTARPSMRIWSRPVEADPDNDIVGSDGISSTVTSARVPDLVSWLRSRRT